MSTKKNRIPERGNATLCAAHTSAGNPCKRRPINGGSVCATHGGSAPQVRRKAEARIAAAADPAAAKLVSLMQDKAVPYNVQLAAAKDLLDRAGIGNKQEVSVELKKWEQDFEGLFVDVGVSTVDTTKTATCSTLEEQ